MIVRIEFIEDRERRWKEGQNRTNNFNIEHTLASLYLSFLLCNARPSRLCSARLRLKLLLVLLRDRLQRRYDVQALWQYAQLASTAARRPYFSNASDARLASRMTRQVPE